MDVLCDFHELGRTKMLIGELLQLGEGSVLTLKACRRASRRSRARKTGREEAVVVNDKLESASRTS